MMHTLAAFIVVKPEHADVMLRRFQEDFDADENFGMWDWWSHGGRWCKALEADGIEEDEEGRFVTTLENARSWKPPIVVTPFGHVFDSAQLTYEVSRGDAWDAVRDSIFDEFVKRNKTDRYEVVMVDVHS